MINNNKILTVSYGTFSCTLEGFDDSFGTMKAIAEYFRGLASEDRYFGAEPPQPDAEMLARIAQKEISRRVEAREHEGKIVLSAVEDDTDAPDEGAPKAAEPQAITSQTATADVAPATQTAVAAAVISAAHHAVEENTSGATEQVDTEAQQQDAQVDEDAPVPEAAELQEDQDISVSDQALDHESVVEDGSFGEDEIAIEEAPAAEVSGEIDGEIDIVPGQPDAEVEAFFENAATAEDVLADDTIAPIAEQLDTPTPAPAADSIAAKLQRIRAVVAQHDDDADEDDYSEDEHANGQDAAQIADIPVDAAVADAAVAEARRDIEDAIDADEAVADVAEDDSDDDVDEIASILNRMAAEDDDADVDAPAHDSAAAPEFEDNDDALANLFDEEAASSAKDTIASVEAEATDKAETQSEASDLTETAQLVASQELRLEPQPAEPAAATPKLPRARVIKVKRADLEAAIQSGELEEYEDEEETADDKAPLGLDDLAPARTATSSLSPEDQDDLARELAELEADIEMEHAPAVEETAAEDVIADADGAVDASFEEPLEDDSIIAAALANASPEAEIAPVEAEIEVEDAPVAADAEDQAPSARAKLPSIDEEGQGEDIARLLAETDHQMGEPESATRRDAFAHLRAAVAAKKADEALGRNDDTVQGDDAYRNDLADVVRPRRPVSGEGRSKRPGEARPAPLKLVAEQRIDADQPVAASTAPVRPRRVAATPEAVPAEIEGESFADYAAEMGATKLPELLEAAASYMSFVEGRDQFSRPQLMTKVRQAGPDAFSREDTLRSFGKLLRDGKIEKIKAGRFAASEDIGFRPDQRAAG